MNRKKPEEDRRIVRCAIYTRKSTEERLDLELNSLDAQREAAESFIASQKSEGWVCLPKRYDDGGFSGGNLDRPAYNELMKDVEAGGIDCVIVYKADRLSRSLFDFAQTMRAFDAYGVSFVSVTQQFNTTNSMGRLTLNILLSFAQFEREIISERISDKIALQRQRGLWCGGQPVLGYDVDRSSTSPKLVINAKEAEMVRTIFDLYLKLGSLLPVVQKLSELGWSNKTWLTRQGRMKGGRPFDKCSLHALLTNQIYIGMIRHKDQVYDGQHEPLIDTALFQRVQAQLKEHGKGLGNRLTNRHNALLKGLLYCPNCGYSMVHCPTKKKSKIYRYYVCQTSIKRGRELCQTGSISAPAIENAVIEEIKCLVTDEGLRREIFEQSERLRQSKIQRQEIQLRQSKMQRSRDQAELQRMSTEGEFGDLNEVRRQELVNRIAQTNARLSELESELERLMDSRFERTDVEEAITDFDRLWGLMKARERHELLGLLISKVEYDRTDGTLSIDYHPTAISALLENVEEVA
ncbi:DNA-invertase hin [Pirellula sp. SH-Sr6A]|uniref:recombinase family protein n=1 Tax=Pirellula sp. SH-Sr6A TaxID=1632865 RepID=UPI00078C2FD9|nr:recombinase family protein [Pirellula sp. SH-Sr6A]AMV35276.1 DNA-invertase hin [Pirellula sp. SH-Sr6A]